MLFLKIIPFAIEDVLSTVNEPYSLLIIPDFFEEKVSFDNTYVKIEVEPEMHLEIQPPIGIQLKLIKMI